MFAPPVVERDYALQAEAFCCAAAAQSGKVLRPKSGTA